MTDALKTKLRAMSSVDDDTGCWVVALTNKGRLPLVWHKGKGQTVRRVAFLSQGGSVPAGKVVSIKCRNWRCINPTHLVCVSRRENTEKMRSIGHWRRALVHRVATARACRSQASEARAAAVREDYADTPHVPTLAERHGLSKRMIYAILAFDRCKPDTVIRLGL